MAAPYSTARHGSVKKGGKMAEYQVVYKKPSSIVCLKLAISTWSNMKAYGNRLLVRMLNVDD